MNEKIDLLKDYLYNIPQITMSFIFGSYSKNQHTIDSDIDIAVYFKPKDNLIEWEETIIYPMEDEIWTNIERILNIETDFIVLNRASSNLALSIISDGVALFIKDNAFYLRFYLLISSAAEYFRDFTKDFYLIKNRSLSLSEIDRDRLIRLTDFLETELNDYPQFINISQKDYLSNSSTRRNTERWIENLINSSIDIAKIILASEKQTLPQTYRQIMEDLSLIKDFNPHTSKTLSKYAKLRNILAHDYIDTRFIQIRMFIDEAESAYKDLLSFVKNLIKI